MFHTTIFSSLCLLASVSAQTGQLLEGPPVRPAPQVVLDKFGLKQATLQDLSIPANQVAGFELVVDLDGTAHQLILREHDIRAAGFKLVAAGKNGMKVLPTPVNSTYRGVVAGQADSQVAASLIGGQLTAYVRFAGLKTPWSLQPLTKVVAGANRATYIVHNGREVKPRNLRCGVNHNAPAPVPTGNPKQAGNPPVYECEIALDVDYDE